MQIAMFSHFQPCFWNPHSLNVSNCFYAERLRSSNAFHFTLLEYVRFFFREWSENFFGKRKKSLISSEKKKSLPIRFFRWGRSPPRLSCRCLGTTVPQLHRSLAAMERRFLGYINVAGKDWTSGGRVFQRINSEARTWLLFFTFGTEILSVWSLLWDIHSVHCRSVNSLRHLDVFHATRSVESAKARRNLRYQSRPAGQKWAK